MSGYRKLVSLVPALWLLLKFLHCLGALPGPGEGKQPVNKSGSHSGGGELGCTFKGRGVKE